MGWQTEVADMLSLKVYLFKIKKISNSRNREAVLSAKKHLLKYVSKDSKQYDNRK